jgi:putative transcriptional regulator
MERGFQIKNTVRAHRVRLGMTQQALAQAVGVTRQTIGLIEVERYNPTLVLALRLERVLEVSIDELFSLVECSG